MSKVRYTVKPSSLGSYFGVGFNDPQDQLSIDLGQLEEVFTEEAEDRMNLGKYLEDASLDYFANKFDMKIEERNIELVELYDGKLRAKFDGVAVKDGETILIENKISNAKSSCFTDSSNYILQVQAYLMDTRFDKALLCGLWQGKPVYKWIERDEEVIEDIKTMVDFVIDYMMGIATINDYPNELYEKYTNKFAPQPLVDVDARLVEYWKALGHLKARESELKKLKTELEKKFEDVLAIDYENGVYNDDFIEVKLGSYERKGGIDYHALSLDHTNIDLEKYREPSTLVKTVRIKQKK